MRYEIRSRQGQVERLYDHLLIYACRDVWILIRPGFCIFKSGKIDNDEAARKSCGPRVLRVDSWMRAGYEQTAFITQCDESCDMSVSCGKAFTQ